MYFKFNHSCLCNIPGFFYPTTVMLIDNDAEFLSETAIELQKRYKTATYTNAKKAALLLTQKKGSEVFKGRETSTRIDKVIEIRDEVYNKNRFNEVLIVVLEYDMQGFEDHHPNYNAEYFTNLVGKNDYYQSHTHDYLLLTSRRFEEFNKEFKKIIRQKNCIKKTNPGHIGQLFDRINFLMADEFQDSSHGIASLLIHDANEKTSFLNDGNFLPIFNTYLKKHKICEGYLFDSQGSLMLLDNKADIHWLFVRNETGIINSIKKAKKWGAPASVIKALESKKLILSLYEPEDFERREKIDWDAYLLKNEVFHDKNKNHEVFGYIPSDYYYAFTQGFPYHGMKTANIISYESFLKNKESPHK